MNTRTPYEYMHHLGRTLLGHDHAPSCIYRIYSHLSQLNMLPNTSSPAFMLSSRLGMASTSHSNGNKRKERQTNTGREGPLWAAVEITRDHDTSPQCKCNYCGKAFCGGATRIRDHILHKCTCASDEALHFQGKLQTAAYKQAAEKWDSDSDSDDTDDEDLKV